MCAYFSKTESRCSEPLRKAVVEVQGQHLDVRNSLRKIGATFLSAREVSAQKMRVQMHSGAMASKNSSRQYFCEYKYP